MSSLPDRSALTRQDRIRRAAAILPGLGLSLLLALVAIAARNATGIAALNPVMVALVLGMALRAAAGMPAALKPGLAFAVRPLLRAAIVLLGLQVTLGGLLSLGAGAMLLALAVVALTLPFTIWLGGRLGLGRGLSALIGMGTAICGASAIVAASQVTRARGEDVSYALAVVTLCGTGAMLLWPLLAWPLGLDELGYGLWAGASVHEVAQAVGAAAAGGEQAVRTGTVMKLARVFLLAPAVLALGWWIARMAGPQQAGAARVAVPWFAFGFLAMVLAGSAGLVPAAAVEVSRLLVPAMLAASVGALGLSTDLQALRARGVAPLLLGVTATGFIAVLALLGVHLIA